MGQFTTTTLEPIEEPVTKGKKEEEVDEDTDPVYAHSFLEAVESRMNRVLNLSRYKKGSTVAEGVVWEEPAQLDTIPLDTLFGNVSLFSEALGTPSDHQSENITAEAHEAMVTLSAEAAENSRAILRDAYEVAIYVDRMADCIQGFISLLEAQGSNSSLRFAPLFYLVGKEDALLSASHDQPVVWVSFADVIYYNQK